MKLQNRTDLTITDHLTQQQAGPGDVIEVDDDLAEHYENHAYWDVLPGYGVAKTTDSSDDDAQGEAD